MVVPSQCLPRMLFQPPLLPWAVVIDYFLCCDSSLMTYQARLISHLITVYLSCPRGMPDLLRKRACLWILVHSACLPFGALSSHTFREGFGHFTSCSDEWKSIIVSSEWWAGPHTTGKYSLSSWSHQMFCFSASLNQETLQACFSSGCFVFLWSVFPENCAARLGVSFMKFSLPDQVEVIWSPRLKKPHHVALPFILHRTCLV